MSVQYSIEEKLGVGITDLLHIEVANESHRHNVPAGSESHFKVLLVSDSFAGMSLLARHRLVNEVLADELKHRLHALAIHCYTSDEWRTRTGGAPMSPPCQGGSNAGER